MKWSKYIKPYILYYILGPLCMIIEVIGEVLMPKFLSLIIDYGLGEKNMQEAPQIIKFIYSLAGNGSVYIVAITVCMILTAILMMIGGVGGAYFGARASVNFGADLRADIYKRVQAFSFSNIDKFSTGSLVTRLTNDVTQLQNFINMLLRMCLRSPGMLIGALIMSISLNPSLTLVLAVTIPLLLLSLLAIITKGFSRFSKVQTKIDNLNSTVQESIINIRVVKSFVREQVEIEKFGTANGELKRSGMSASGMMILTNPVMTFFMNVTTITVLWFGGNMVIDNSMSVGELTAFTSYVTQILNSLMMVSMMFMMFSRAMASARRIKEVCQEKIDITDKENLTPDEASATIQRGEIEFKDISFRYYKNSAEAVLNGLNLKIPAGSTVGVIGSTGCGKTTLVALIPRLYDPDNGQVLIDGRDVKNYSLFNLREGIGMVLQKNLLFSGTVEDNLRWGNEYADFEDIVTASRQAQADGFIKNMDKGYKTDLERGGANVSGGQRQRLCIARALLKNPKILILDDSTSAVDTATEAKIRHALEHELADSTRIIIAQRISSVQNADMIVVMDNGNITGVGTHSELMATNQEYKEIYQSQVEEKEVEG